MGGPDGSESDLSFLLSALVAPVRLTLRGKMHITDDMIERAIAHIRAVMKEEIGARGDRPFISPHEGLGSITEEYYEFVEAVHGGNLADIHDEAADVAVAAIWTVASLLGFWEKPKYS